MCSRALHRAAVGVQLRAADQAAKGIVLEAVTRKLTRRIAVAQARKRAFCVVGIGNVTTAIIRLPDQSVKPVIGIADGIAVGVGRGFQVAAARGVVVDIIIIGIGGKGAAPTLVAGGLTPDIIGKVIILVLRRTRCGRSCGRAATDARRNRCSRSPQRPTDRCSWRGRC